MRQVKYIGLKAGALQVTVTTTATSLRDLLQTADATLTDAMLRHAQYIRLDAEGAVRWGVGGDPTASVGQRLQNNTPEEFYGITPDEMILIASGNTSVNVLIGEIVR